MKLAPVLHKFLEYCNPRKSILILRHKFFPYRQQEGQNFHDFATEFKKLSSKCEFDKLKYSLIKDMVVCGTFVKDLFENATSLCPKQLVQAMLLRKPISMPIPPPPSLEILTSQPTADIDKTFKKKLNTFHNTRNLNTRDCIKNVNYTIVHISETNAQLMEKFVMFAIKRTI